MIVHTGTYFTLTVHRVNLSFLSTKISAVENYHVYVGINYKEGDYLYLKVKDQFLKNDSKNS